MESRLNVILLALQPQAIQVFFQQVDMERIQVLEVFSDYNEKIKLILDEKQKDIKSFSALLPYIEKYKNMDVYWIVGSAYFETANLEAIAKLLRERGIARDHILNGYVGNMPHYQGNLRYAEHVTLDYIATGISYMEVGLDATQIPYHGANLAVSSQDLYYGYRTAVDIFAHGNPLKFCLIGVCPYILGYEMRRSFSTLGVGRQYELLLPDEVLEEDLFFSLLSDSFKNAYIKCKVPEELNNETFKRTLQSEILVNKFFNVKKSLADVIVKLHQKSFMNNLQIFQDYIHLCNQHGAKPIAVMLPFSPVIHDRYPKRELADFRSILRSLHDAMNLQIIDLFDLKLDYSCFYDLVHLNMHGAAMASQALAEQLKRIMSVQSPRT